MANINYEALKEQLLAQGIALNFCVVNESNQNLQDSISEHFGTGTAPPVAMSEDQVRNEESFEFGQSLEAYNIHLSRNVREIVCKPKPCAFFDAFSSPLIFLFALKLEEMQSGAHQTCVSLFDSKDGAKKFSAGNTIHR